MHSLKRSTLVLYSLYLNTIMSREQLAQIPIYFHKTSSIGEFLKIKTSLCRQLSIYENRKYSQFQNDDCEETLFEENYIIVVKCNIIIILIIGVNE